MSNMAGTINTLEAIRQHSIKSKYYQASSSEQFGKVQETPQKETTPFYPRSPYGCFPIGTKILCQVQQKNRHGIITTTGNKKIEDIKKEDNVLSYNLISGQKEFKKVTNIFSRDAKELYCITFSNGNMLECTEEHPVFVYSKSWVKAKDLKVGDEVIQYKYSGLNRRIKGINQKGYTNREIYGENKTLFIKNKHIASTKKYYENKKEYKIKKFKNAFIEDVISSYIPTVKTKNKYKIKDTSRMHHVSWNKGLTKETDVRVRKQAEILKKLTYQKHPSVRRKISDSIKKLWQTKEYRDKILKAQNKRPNKIEKHISYILDIEFPNEFKYVGNRSLFLGNPPKNPDWVHITKNKVIEFFGRLWHEASDEKEIIDHYEKCGYDCLVIWEEELGNESVLVYKIKNFLYNKNTEIVKISSITKKVKYCKVFNLEVEDNNNYFAYGILVHNCSKLYSYWQTVNYRESYNIFACNGILFNHTSPRRGETFVSRKITRAATRIKLGLQDKLLLGNLDAKRDWGFAGDYIEAMWLMLQHDKPDDYIVASGETHSIREFLDETFGYLNMDWEKYVGIDPKYFRPAEVDLLLGDPSKIKKTLNWEPKVSFKQLVKMMIDSDLKLAQQEKLLKDHNIL